MSKIGFAVAAMGMVAVLGAAEPVSAASTHYAPGVTLNVVVEDLASVPAAVLEKARTHTARVFQNINVDVTWLDSGDPRLDNPDFYRTVVIVYLFPQVFSHRLNTRATALGMASGTRVATVFYDRIQRLFPAGSPKDISCALGHVIAHEIGHLMLESKPHSPHHSSSGIMQQGLNVQLASRGALFFAATEARKIRSKISLNEVTRQD